MGEMKGFCVGAGPAGAFSPEAMVFVVVSSAVTGSEVMPEGAWANTPVRSVSFDIQILFILRSLQD